MKQFYSFLMLTLALCLTWGSANAQQSLPYSYGFEDNDLSVEGWSSTNGDISEYAAKTGYYGFRFAYTATNAYLVSPLLTGGTYGVNVSFYYRAYSDTYLDHFKVGYTTDPGETDPSSFTYGTLITSSTSWQQYDATFPAGTVRIAIFYDDDNHNDGYYLYLDDFTFEAASSCAKPTDLTVDYTSGNSTAEVSWTSGATEWDIDVNGIVTHTTNNPYTINGLLPATIYTVKVQADCGSEQSGWVNAGSFTTPCPTSFAIPYTYGFENEGGIDCWTLSPVDKVVIYKTDPAYAHLGNNFVMFSYTETPPQYLISPELSGITNGLHVQFYYRQYTSGVETFHVGYSTTNNDPESFIWGDEITASTSYQRFSADYPAGTKYVAVKHTSDDQYYLFVDDFTFEESSSCLEPTGVTATLNGTSNIDISWTAGSSETSWEVYITTDPDEDPGSDNNHFIPSVLHTTSINYDGSAATTYYFYVRAICSATDTSNWSSPAIIKTKCEAMSLPYEYDFEDNDNFEYCWNIINTNTSYLSVSTMNPGNGSYALAFYRGFSFR